VASSRSISVPAPIACQSSGSGDPSTAATRQHSHATKRAKHFLVPQSAPFFTRFSACAPGAYPVILGPLGQA
jgi:hypothetical protein